jgi:hypothetical protein
VSMKKQRSGNSLIELRQSANLEPLNLEPSATRAITAALPRPARDRRRGRPKLSILNYQFSTSIYIRPTSNNCPET